jgi:alkylation response protein AidB-like acyl-CoA dehydrogenase
MTSYEEISSLVKKLEPILRAGASVAETERNVPKSTVDAIRDAGLFKIWVPKNLGGWEVDPVTALRIFEDISSIDSAAGWLVQMSAAVGGLGVFFEDKAVDEMFKGGDNILADSFSPPGQAVPVEGGYKLTGQFPFASNCRNADWFIALGMVMDGKDPKLVDGNPMMKMMAFPMSEAKVVDNWNTLGMRGTGSNDVKATDLFVPEHRAPALAPITAAANSKWSSEIANLTIWHIITSMGVAPLGIARAAIESFVVLGKAKTPAYQVDPMNTQALAHYRLGEAKAILAGARAGLFDSMSRTWDSASAGNLITTEQKCDLQMAASYAARAACDAVELVAASSGAAAFREGTPLDRHLRDLRTITQHAFISSDRFRDVGAISMGQAAAWGFMGF